MHLIWSLEVLSGQPVEPPNFVFLIAEDCSKHHFGLFDEHGVATPNIKKLADEGLIYRHAFSNSPVCSVARTTLMTMCYPATIAAHHHRTSPQAELPEQISMFPTYLRQAGYYTSNNAKTDYNVTGGDLAWDESSRKATWRKRAAGQPFFHMHTFPITHESRLHFPASDVNKKPIAGLENVFVQPRHPDTPLFRYTRARYHQQIRKLDQQIATVVGKLEADGLLDSTFIFFFGDHGGVLPGTKGYLFETGLHVPLVVRIPEKYRDDHPEVKKQIDQFVSFIDFGPTLLNLAGLELPKREVIAGQPFLGPNVDHASECQTTFGFADRFDERIGRVRSVRHGNFKFIRNYQPWYFDGLQNNYRYKMAAYREWRALFNAGKLNATQSAFFRTAPVEQLFDLEADPWETKNLAASPRQSEKLAELKSLLSDQQKMFSDLGFVPESRLPNSEVRQPAGFDADIAETISPSTDDITNFNAIGFSIASMNRDERLQQKVEQVLKEVDCRLVKMRAIEYLAIVAGQDPAEEILKLLADCDSPLEAAEILNAIVALRDGEKKFVIPVTPRSIHPAVREHNNVQRRLEYLVKP